MKPALEPLLEYCRAQSRVCPMPLRWNDLYDMLPEDGGSKKGGPPLILGAWGYTSDLEKMVRLRAHLQWAEEHGVLPQVELFLRGLPESEWYHMPGVPVPGAWRAGIHPVR